jgi:hypothetical protein
MQIVFWGAIRSQVLGRDRAYLQPPDKAVVLCCDEESECPALQRIRPGLPLTQGQVGRSLTIIIGTEQ